ncbi:MAG TPA: 50S ribosomal protein L9 [Bacteroidales bacterium]|nr:50S ribosomal protein L9 [Bacteroidales bacterium]HRZ48738.1 50S ribosomal protein L9 [Bacteroidales bacterium]
MEIILKQDIPSLGFTNDMVTVKDGYARNYLIPKGYAIVATPSAKKVLAENLKQKAHKAEKIRLDAEGVAKALDGLQLRIAAKASTSGRIFGSVNSIQIAEAIKQQYDLDVDRKKIFLDGDSVKELGTYSAKIRLHKEVEAMITFEVFAE